MAVRATALEAAAFGVETTAGTAVAALKRLLALSVKLAPNNEVATIQSAGYRVPTKAIQHYEDTDITVDGGLCYNAMGLMLQMLFKQTTASSLGSGAYEYLFTPSSASDQVPATCTLEVGSNAWLDQVTYALLTDLSWGFTRTETNFSAKGFGRAITTGVNGSTCEVQTVTITGSPTGGTFTLTFNGSTTATIAYNAAASAVQSALEALASIGTGNVSVSGSAGGPYSVTFKGDLGRQNVNAMTASGAGLTGGTSPSVTIATPTPGVAPTEIAVSPVLGSQINGYIDTTYGGIGGTQLADLFAGSFELSGWAGRKRVVNTSYSSFAARVAQASQPKITLEAEANTQAYLQLSRLRAGTRQYLRFDSTGSLIGGSNYERFRMDAAVDVVSVTPQGDRDGITALTAEFAVVHDATMGSSLAFDVINSQASY